MHVQQKMQAYSVGLMESANNSERKFSV